MEMIYPKPGTVIYIPYELSGEQGKTVLEIAHRNPSNVVFWHLDGVYLGSTRTFHSMALQPVVGRHKLTLVDQAGYRLEQAFEIIGK